MNFTKLYFLIFVCFLVITSCSNQNKKTLEAKDAIAVDSVKSFTKVYAIDTATASVGWTASEGLAAIRHGHDGAFKISKGTVTVKDSLVTGGDFEININGVRVLDIKDNKRNAKLTGHLKNADFFETDKFPTATFQIVSSSAIATDSLEVTGNLTMKGVTKSIVFPAKVNFSDDLFSAQAKFYINRKDWNMHYRSEESFGDELIRNEVLVELNINGK